MTRPGVGGGIRKVNLGEKLASFADHWSPKIVAALNGQHVRLAKLLGDFPWHHHPDEDELFLVLRGRLVLRFQDGEVTLNEGEFCVVPRGVEHQPFAAQEVHVLLFEPAATRNTGNLRNERTIERLETL